MGEKKSTSTKIKSTLQTPAPATTNFFHFFGQNRFFGKSCREKSGKSKISFFRFRLSSRIFAYIHLPAVMDSIKNPLLSRYERRPIHSMNLISSLDFRRRSSLFGFPPEPIRTPSWSFGWEKFDLGSRNPRTNEKLEILSKLRTFPGIQKFREILIRVSLERLQREKKSPK